MNTRVANCDLWFLKLPHSEANKQGIFNVNILGGSSSVLELLETIGNSAKRIFCDFPLKYLNTVRIKAEFQGTDFSFYVLLNSIYENVSTGF